MILDEKKVLLKILIQSLLILLLVLVSLLIFVLLLVFVILIFIISKKVSFNNLIKGFSTIDISDGFDLFELI